MTKLVIELNGDHQDDMIGLICRAYGLQTPPTAEFAADRMAYHCQNIVYGQGEFENVTDVISVDRAINITSSVIE